MEQQDKLIDKNEWQHVVTIGRDNRSKYVPEGDKTNQCYALQRPDIEQLFLCGVPRLRGKATAKKPAG
ncbi:hypothetical protein P4S64_23155 [Vibrio sp. M60_M31a]